MIAFLAESVMRGRRAIHANEFLDARCTSVNTVRSRSTGAVIGFIASTTHRLQGQQLTGIVVVTDVPPELIHAAAEGLDRAAQSRSIAMALAQVVDGMEAGRA